MKKILTLGLFLLSSQMAYGYQIDNTIINDSGGEQATVTNNGLDINLKPASSVGSGQKNGLVSGTSVVLGSSTSILSVTVKANDDNQGIVFIGNSGVNQNNGYQLSTGDTVSMDIDNVTDIYVTSTTGTNGVSYIYIVQ